MKKLFTLLGLITSSILFAQLTPQGFNYQATIRNSAGDLWINKQVNFRFKIIRDNDNSVPYSELQTTITDALGGVQLIIGNGDGKNGSLGFVEWGGAAHSLGIEMYTDGGSYIDMEKRPLVSVPYALYAQNAFFHNIGDLYQGGIIVSVWKDENLQEHGLISSLTDLGITKDWSTAKNICDNYVSEGYDDWYLPSFLELREAMIQTFRVNEVLNESGFGLFTVYWSSTTNNVLPEYALIFGLNSSGSYIKDGTSPGASSGGIRAVRRF